MLPRGGKSVMLAWQTLAAHNLIEGRLAAPFSIRAKTGFGHYFVTAPTGREANKVKAFKAWVRDEIAETMRQLNSV